MKKILLVFFAMIFMFALIGCDMEAEAPETKTVTREEGTDVEEEAKITGDLAGIVQQFKEAGLAIGEKQSKAFEMLGASDGFGIEVNGEIVELYYFDPSQITQDVTSKIEDAKETGSYMMGDHPLPAIVNGSYILVGSNEHPEEERITSVFLDY